MVDRRKFIIGGITIAFAGTTLPTLLLAAKSKVFSNSSTSIAINGYDPVAYFTEGKPVEGSGDFSLSWNGATWRFASLSNKEKFAASPDKFAPQYGGYCAYAVSYGSTATTEPEAWTIVDNKLYLNYSLGVRKRWRTDTKGYIAKADNNWPGVLE